MDKTILSIYSKNIDIINYSEKTITYLRLQNYYRALNYYKNVIEDFVSVLDNLILELNYFNKNTTIVDINLINNVLMDILSAQENKDYILLADLLELSLIPLIEQIQGVIIDNNCLELDSDKYDSNITKLTSMDEMLGEQLMKLNCKPIKKENVYEVEYTMSGLLTLALYDHNKKYYLHSNSQVLHEAGIIARDWFTEDKESYIIYGLGLGYHIQELLELDDSIQVNVYESDLNIIMLACGYGCMDKLLSNERFQLIFDPNFIDFGKTVSNINIDSQFYIHYPSIRNIKSEKIKEQIEEYFVSYSSVKNQLHSLHSNFRLNTRLNDAYVDSIKDDFVGKDLYIIAAGPSLDKNYMQLKNVGNEGIILATGTVYKKLLNHGIRPDYIILIDANAGVYTQTEDVADIDIPLLYLSTAYHKVPANYKGARYMVCQQGYDKAEVLAKSKGYNLYRTGGSVSTTSLDIGIQFGCKRIIYLGLDLAYTDKKDHATDTAYFNKIESDDLRFVEDIYGNLVGTSKNLDIYRKWIEQRIKEAKGSNIEFIDATEGGAKIEGMKIVELKQILKANYCGLN